MAHVAVPTRVVIDNAARGTGISRDLWGIFFEDINYAADGGLYGELVQNRSFAYSDRDQPDWHALTGWLVPPHAHSTRPAPVRIGSSEPLHPRTVTAQSDTARGVAPGSSALDVSLPAHGAALLRYVPR